MSLWELSTTASKPQWPKEKNWRMVQLSHTFMKRILSSKILQLFHEVIQCLTNHAFVWTLFLLYKEKKYSSNTKSWYKKALLWFFLSSVFFFIKHKYCFNQNCIYAAIKHCLGMSFVSVSMSNDPPWYKLLPKNCNTQITWIKVLLYFAMFLSQNHSTGTLVLFKSLNLKLLFVK